MNIKVTSFDYALKAFTRKRHLAHNYEFTIYLNRRVVCVLGVVCANAHAIAVAVRGKEPVT
jgi:hypothetical protein